jgi:serine/threonine protein kinase
VTDEFEDLIFRSIDRAASGVIDDLRDLEPKPGQQIAQYRIIERLGAGGMGVVFKAEDTRLGRFVALKFLHPLASDDAAGRAQLEREARAASALSHRAICTVHDVDLVHRPGFIVMELLEGETLKDRLAHGPLHESAALEVGRAVASALEAAHERGLVHCDIKPANVFITDAAEVKVLDFGISRLHRDVPPATGSDPAAGSRAFMSPEQAAGGPLDRRTDIYSFGMLMRAMVASPGSRLARAIARMTEAAAGGRQQTMAEVVMELDAIRRRRVTRSRRWALAAAALVIAAAGGA